MQSLLQIIDDDQIIQTVNIGEPTYSRDKMTYSICVTEIDLPPQARPSRRRRNHGGREAIQRFFDPDRDHPALKKVISTLAPIAVSFLTNQLPEWLGDIDLSGPSAVENSDQ